MSECPNQMQIDHSEDIARLQIEMKTTKEDVRDFKKLTEAFVELAGDVKVICKTLEQNNIDIKDIKDNMGTKESVARLHTHVEDLEEEVTTLKNKPGQDALKEQKQIRWLLISTIILLVINMLWDKIF